LRIVAQACSSLSSDPSPNSQRFNGLQSLIELAVKGWGRCGLLGGSEDYMLCECDINGHCESSRSCSNTWSRNPIPSVAPPCLTFSKTFRVRVLRFVAITLSLAVVRARSGWVLFVNLCLVYAGKRGGDEMERHRARMKETFCSFLVLPFSSHPFTREVVIGIPLECWGIGRVEACPFCFTVYDHEAPLLFCCSNFLQIWHAGSKGGNKTFTVFSFLT
jgi:hypothetical protein